MAPQSRRKRIRAGKAAAARLGMRSIQQNADYNLVKIVAVEDKVPDMASTNAINAAYKVVANSEAAKIVAEHSSIREMRSSIFDTIENVHASLSWESLTMKWEALQNSGSAEYSSEVIALLTIQHYFEIL